MTLCQDCLKEIPKYDISCCFLCNACYFKRMNKRMGKYQANNICPHCKMDKRIRNPSGFCDHLYYPDSCKICKERESKVKG